MAAGPPFEQPDAEPETLESAADSFNGISGRISGQGTDMSGAIKNGSFQFSDMIAEPIQSVAGDNEDAWSSAMQASSVASAVTSAWAAGVKEFKKEIKDLNSEWDEFLATEDDYDEDSEFASAKEEKREELVGRYKSAKSTCEDVADTAAGDLNSAPEDVDIERLVEDGTMSWYEAHVFFGADRAGEPPPEVIEEQAAYTSKLLSGSGEDAPSEKDLKLANERMELFSGSALYNTRLMEQIGPQGLVDSAAVIGSGDYDSDLIVQTQQNMGAALAVATNFSGTKASVDRQWVQQLMDAGARPIDIDGAPIGTGYSALAPLLIQEKEPFAPEFLVPVTEHQMMLSTLEPWTATLDLSGGPNPFDPTGQLDRQPLNATFIALDNNPEVAAALYSHPERYAMRYEVDGVLMDNEFLRDQGVLGEDEKFHPLDFVLDIAPGEDGSGSDTGIAHIDLNLAGNSVQAGATGMSADEWGTREPPERTEDMAEVATKVIKAVGEDKDVILEDKDGALYPMVDNFTDITMHYMDDIHNLMYVEGGASYELQNKGASLGFDGPNAYLNEFIEGLGADDTAATQISTNSMMYGMMAAEANAASSPEFSEGELSAAYRPHMALTGMLDSGGMEAIHDRFEKMEEDADQKVDLVKAAGNGAIISATAVGPALASGGTATMAGLAASGPIITYGSEMVDELAKPFEADYSSASELEQEQLRLDRRTTYEQAMQTHTDNLLRHYYSDQLDSEVAQGAESHPHFADGQDLSQETELNYADKVSAIHRELSDAYDGRTY